MVVISGQDIYWLSAGSIPLSAQLRTGALNKRGKPNGYDFCYKSSILDLSKKSRFDIHIFS